MDEEVEQLVPIPYLTSLYREKGALFSRSYAVKHFSGKNPHHALLGKGTDLYGGLLEALKRMPDSEKKVAVENALGGGRFKGEPLAERRRSMAKHLGVSDRTLYRRESAGALEFIEIIEDMKPSLRATDTNTDNEDLSALFAEVRELKAMVARLEEAFGTKP